MTGKTRWWSSVRRHGMSKTKVYQAWLSMRRRCYEASNASFEDYGGRGIEVCERWRGSFEAFFEDMGHPPDDSHSLDRIDSDGNYEPSNCRWATLTRQIRNRGVARMLTYKGETLGLADMAEKYGVPYRRLASRIKRHWTLERALNEEKVTSARLVDRTGQRFSRLVVVRRSDAKSAGRNAVWECLCDCGNMTLASSDKLLKGDKKSCGCWHKEAIALRTKGLMNGI
jgi:hypothetical protein